MAVCQIDTCFSLSVLHFFLFFHLVCQPRWDDWKMIHPPGLSRRAAIWGGDQGESSAMQHDKKVLADWSLQWNPARGYWIHWASNSTPLHFTSLLTAYHHSCMFPWVHPTSLKAAVCKISVSTLRCFIFITGDSILRCRGKLLFLGGNCMGNSKILLVLQGNITLSV